MFDSSYATTHLHLRFTDHAHTVPTHPRCRRSPARRAIGGSLAYRNETDNRDLHSSLPAESGRPNCVTRVRGTFSSDGRPNCVTRVRGSFSSDGRPNCVTRVRGTFSSDGLPRRNPRGVLRVRDHRVAARVEERRHLLHVTHDHARDGAAAHLADELGQLRVLKLRVGHIRQLGGPHLRGPASARDGTHLAERSRKGR